VNEPVIVVTGLPRSGTSMMMRMLEAGGLPVVIDGQRKSDVDNPHGYYEYEPVKTLKQDSSWVPGARGKAVKMVYLLLRDLPPSITYEVLFMRRDLEEVIASQDEMVRRKGEPVSPDESRRLIGLFRDELQRIDAWLKDRGNFRVLYLDYGLTIDDPERICAQITRFLSVELDERRMQSVVMPSLYRQRRAQVERRKFVAPRGS
jgi:hypothetical protein